MEEKAAKDRNGHHGRHTSVSTLSVRGARPKSTAHYSTTALRILLLWFSIQLTSGNISSGSGTRATGPQQADVRWRSFGEISTDIKTVLGGLYFLGESFLDYRPGV